MNQQQQPHNRNQSDVARLLHQIDCEYQAAYLGLSGIALGTSTHAFITKRMEGIEDARAKLVDLVGEEQAGRLIVEQMDKSAESKEGK